MKEAHIEIPSTIGHVERYHDPFTAEYRTKHEELIHETTDALFIQISTFETDRTVGPEGLCLILS